jgi:hypothetical protein
MSKTKKEAKTLNKLIVKYDMSLIVNIEVDLLVIAKGAKLYGNGHRIFAKKLIIQ